MSRAICALGAVLSGLFAVALIETPSTGSFWAFLIKAGGLLILALALLIWVTGTTPAADDKRGPFVASALVLDVLAYLLFIMVPGPITVPKIADASPQPSVAAKADPKPVKPASSRSAPTRVVVDVGQVLGHWITPLAPSAAQFLTIRKHKGVYEVVVELFHRHDPLILKLREGTSKHGRRFDVVGDAEGTYYILLANGDLDIRSQDGEFIVAKRFYGDANNPKAVDDAIGALWAYTACRIDAQCMGEKYRFDVMQDCPDLIERAARYEFRWNNGLFQSRFVPGEAWHGRDGEKKGLIDYVGDSIEFENGFGAWQNYVYVCTFDIGKKQIVDLKLRPGRLRY